MSDDWMNSTESSLDPARADDGTALLAVAAGLVAALIGGAVWAAIAIFGNLEVGWVAWGIGVLAGGAMTMATRRRSRSLAVVAAALALVGLLAGKAMTFAGSAGPIAEEMLADDAYMQGMTAWNMYGAGQLAPEIQGAVADTEARGDTLSDALWADMLAAADARLQGMSDDERRALARHAAAAFIRDRGLVAGVRDQLSGFDLLWLFLALATAFRLMDAPKPEPAVAPAPEQEREPVA